MSRAHFLSIVGLRLRAFGAQPPSELILQRPVPSDHRSKQWEPHHNYLQYFRVSQETYAKTGTAFETSGDIVTLQWASFTQVIPEEQCVKNHEPHAVGRQQLSGVEASCIFVKHLHH